MAYTEEEIKLLGKIYNQIIDDIRVFNYETPRLHAKLKEYETWKQSQEEGE